MEGLIAAIAPNVVQLLGVVITGLITWGVSMLKQKTAADIGKKALDEVDRVTATVVDGLTQTMAEQLRAAYADGKWTDEDKKNIKAAAVNQTLGLLSTSVTASAGKIVGDLQGYIATKIEAQVFAQKQWPTAWELTGSAEPQAVETAK